MSRLALAAALALAACAVYAEGWIGRIRTAAAIMGWVRTRAVAPTLD